MKIRSWKNLGNLRGGIDTMSTPGLRLLIGIAAVLLNHSGLTSDDTQFSAVTEIVIANPSKANPRKDCLEAMKKGDFRYVGIHGIVVSLPGVEHYDPRFPHGVKIITGSGDHAETPAEREFQNAAERYAKEYNRYLLRHLGSGDLKRGSGSK